jgi:hypothetical protein
MTQVHLDASALLAARDVPSTMTPRDDLHLDIYRMPTGSSSFVVFLLINKVPSHYVNLTVA